MPGTQITAYSEVEATLNDLQSRVQGVLGAQIAGIYLYGSLATGDFDPRTSDIDFVVVTTDELPVETFPVLEAMHRSLATSGSAWAVKLEGAYLSRAALRRHDPADRPRPYVNEGRFHLARLGSDWVIQRHVLREHGVTVFGPAPETVIDPIPPGALRQAVLEELSNWWEPMLLHPDPRLSGRTYQAYAVLSMCRVLYTVHHAMVTSKPVSARWVLVSIDQRWHGLIEDALAWPDGAQRDQLPETLAFIRYTIERVQPDDRNASGAP